MAIYILIMETNRLMRKAIVQMVEVCGFHSVPMEDEERALDALHGVRFDVLITATLPGCRLTSEFVTSAKRIQPDLGIIAGRIYDRKGAPLGPVDFYIDVPFSRYDLRNAIKTIMLSETSVRLHPNARNIAYAALPVAIPALYPH